MNSELANLISNFPPPLPTSVTLVQSLKPFRDSERTLKATKREIGGERKESKTWPIEAE